MVAVLLTWVRANGVGPGIDPERTGRGAFSSTWLNKID
jgi:hypothetical protein